MNELKPCHDKQEWDEYVLEHNGHPLQLWGWGELKSANGWSTDRLFMINRVGDTIGAAQILVRHLPWPFKSLSYIPRGPIANEDNRGELLQILARHVKKAHHSVSLTVEPDSKECTLPQVWKKSNNHILPARTIILDLEKPEAELLNNMVKKTRQYIRKSASEAIQIKQVRSREDLDKCLAIYHDTAKKAKFNLHDNQYYYDVFNKLDDYSPVFAAYSDNQPIAFLWLAISASTSYELYGGASELGQQLRSNYALKWHAIRKCKEWGLSRYDFGGLIDGGVTTFKLGWASEQTELAGTFDHPLSIFYGLWSNILPTAKKIVRKMKSLFRHR
jgi:lipid II:glycine glycyltransferase (peptidoglycan interpeptide bridge formation enzyme)